MIPESYRHRIPFPTCATCRHSYTRFHRSTDPASPEPKPRTTCKLSRLHVSPRMIACPLFAPPKRAPTPA